MAGPTKFNTPEKVYTSGEKKSITIESIQAQLDDLKKDMNADEWGFSDDGSLMAIADSIRTESQQNRTPEGTYTGKYQRYQNELELLEIEMLRQPINLDNLKQVVGMFPEGM